MNGSQYISIADIAEKIGCSPITIWRAIQRGIIPAAPLPGGRKLWVERAAAEAYIEDMTTRAEKEASERRAAREGQMTFDDLF